MSLRQLFIVCIALPVFSVCGAGTGQQDEASGELVFRAFRQGLPVTGLKAKDLRLRIDGREQPVAALSEASRRLGAGTAPRLVALLVNVADANLDLTPGIEFLVTKFLRAGDQLLFCSNNFFLSTHVVSDLAAEKARLQQIISLEKRKFQALYQAMRFQLSDLLNRTGRMIDGQTSEEVGFATPEWNRQGVYPEAIRRNFIHIFTQTAQSYKKFFLQLDDEKMRSLAAACSGWQQDKLVFVLYECPGFFAPEPTSYMASYLAPSEMFKKLHEELYVAPASQGETYGRQFARRGTTWHSLLLTPEDRIPLEVSSETVTLRLDRRRIASLGQELLPQLSRQTGGIVSESSNFTEFFTLLSSREEAFYRLDFARQPEAPGREIRLETAAASELIYDDRPGPAAMASATGEQAAPLLRIAGMEVGKQKLNVMLDGTAPLVSVNIQLTDKQVNQHLNQSSEIFLGGAGKKLVFSLPKLGRGVYDLVVEAVNTAGGENDIVVRRLQVDKSGWSFEF